MVCDGSEHPPCVRFACVKEDAYSYLQEHGGTPTRRRHWCFQRKGDSQGQGFIFSRAAGMMIAGGLRWLDWP